MKTEEKTREKISPLIAKILKHRGIDETNFAKFLNPTYDDFNHDPFLFPDMKKAVARIKLAKQRGEKITIYGDYDIDGMAATVILWESLRRFGLNVATYTPDRFREGYGLNVAAVEQIAKTGAKLIITVDNGTLSFDEIARAKALGVDVIVTDHHSPHEDLPAAVAILNPKILVAQNPEMYDEKFQLIKFSRKDFDDKNDEKFAKNSDENIAKNLVENSAQKTENSRENLYPFCDLCGAGVAFKLVQALQIDSLKNAENFAKYDEKFAKNLVENSTKNSRKNSQKISRNPYLIPFAKGQEKWLLDLVALGTVCDVVGLVDENRADVKWGLEVLKKTRRSGLRALVAVAKTELARVDARTLGFVLGPRLNASGRLETAEYALELLKLHDVATASRSEFDDENFAQNSLKNSRNDDKNFAQNLTQNDVNARALELAEKLEKLNQQRRKVQDEIFANAAAQIEKEDEILRENFAKNRDENASKNLLKNDAEKSRNDDENFAKISRKNNVKSVQTSDENSTQNDAKNSPKIFAKNPVAIAVGDGWHEGVIGIVAAKILEKFERPAFVLSRGKAENRDAICEEKVAHKNSQIDEKNNGNFCEKIDSKTGKKNDENFAKKSPKNSRKNSPKNSENDDENLTQNDELNSPNKLVNDAANDEYAGGFAKGSGRSFGDFSCAAVIHATDKIIERGGGHLAAGGLTVRNDRIEEWKNAVQNFYRETVKNPEKQVEFLYPKPDVILEDFANLSPELLDEIAKLEPFGQANQAPVFAFANVLIFARRTMGKNGEHVRYVFADREGRKLTCVAFSAAEKFRETPFDEETGAANFANISVELMANEWNGATNVEGRLIRMERAVREN